MPARPSPGSPVYPATASSRAPLRPASLSDSPHSSPSTAFCAVLQGSLFGQLGTMPSTYSTLFLSGQGLAGIFAALAMLMSMASEWTWVVGGAEVASGILGSRQSVLGERCLGFWVEMEVMGSWGWVWG